MEAETVGIVNLAPETFRRCLSDDKPSEVATLIPLILPDPQGFPVCTYIRFNRPLRTVDIIRNVLKDTDFVCCLLFLVSHLSSLSFVFMKHPEMHRPDFVLAGLCLGCRMLMLSSLES